MNVIAWLKFELAYYDPAVQRFNYYTTEYLLLLSTSIQLWLTEFEKSTLHGLNKGFGLKFREAFRVRQETTEKGRRTHLGKCCEYNDENNSPITLNYKKKSIWCIQMVVKWNNTRICPTRWEYTHIDSWTSSMGKWCKKEDNLMTVGNIAIWLARSLIGIKTKNRGKNKACEWVSDFVMWHLSGLPNRHTQR